MSNTGPGGASAGATPERVADVGGDMLLAGNGKVFVSKPGSLVACSTAALPASCADFIPAAMYQSEVKDDIGSALPFDPRGIALRGDSLYVIDAGNHLMAWCPTSRCDENSIDWAMLNRNHAAAKDESPLAVTPSSRLWGDSTGVGAPKHDQETNVDGPTSSSAVRRIVARDQPSGDTLVVFLDADGAMKTTFDAQNGGAFGTAERVSGGAYEDVALTDGGSLYLASDGSLVRTEPRAGADVQTLAKGHFRRLATMADDVFAVEDSGSGSRIVRVRGQDVVTVVTSAVAIRDLAIDDGRVYFLVDGAVFRAPLP